ncbi:MAG: hypothetical protein AAGJ35_03940, partial [Myxococcota bacterium]
LQEIKQKTGGQFLRFLMGQTIRTEVLLMQILVSLEQSIEQKDTFFPLQTKRARISGSSW